MNDRFFIDTNVFIYTFDAGDKDKNTIAAAITSGCSVLYTEDLHHSQKIHTLTIENPFY